FSCGRRMHHTVAAEAVGKEKPGHIRRRTEDGVVVGRHFVKSSPGTFRVDSQVLEDRYTAGGVCENLFYKSRIKISFIAGRFLRIIPCKKKATSFRSKMKSR